MSTASTEMPFTRPRVVGKHERSPGDQLRHDIDKRSWARFLVAKEAILGRLQRGGETITRLADRKGLGSALRLAQRTLGWLVGLARTLRAGVRTTGVLPAAALALTTAAGQSFVTTVAGAVGTGVCAVVSGFRSAAGWILRLFGSTGARLADALDQRADRLASALRQRVLVLKEAAGILISPSGIVMSGVRGLAQARLLSALVSRVIPAPWSLLVRLVCSVLSLPRLVRNELVMLLGGLTVRWEPAPSPDNEPTPPPADVVDLETQRAEREAQQTREEVEVLERALRGSRPATSRNSNARRKR